ncbi:energy transducer TonB [uncultured Sphingomonas sp.]|uniref:energy transducer TonB n=1 Tax=uncultured Sphingomonas sp. TaxID=158754 RepID=UPI0025F9B07F|nr:energy transducer TonB [uncultured Sphingomonas sp.]
MIDEDAQPTRVTVLKGDVRSPPREGGSRFAGERRGLMIGVLVLVVLVLLALMVVGGELVRRAFDQASPPRVWTAPSTVHDGTASRDSMNPADWITNDDYPPEALRHNEQGTVTIRWSITSAGRVRDCEVLESSGHASLDVAACRAITRNGRYPPIAADAPVRQSTRRIVWKIPEDGPAAGEAAKPIDIATARNQDSAIEVAITVGYDGKVESCRVVGALPPSGGDPCAATPRGTWMGPGFVRDGKPVKAVLHRRWSSTTTFE